MKLVFVAVVKNQKNVLTKVRFSTLYPNPNPNPNPYNNMLLFWAVHINNGLLISYLLSQA